MLEIIQLAGQLGAVPCIVLVVLFIIFKHQDSKNKQNERQNEQQLENQRDQNLINGILEAIKTSHSVEHTPEDEDNKREVNEYILKQLNCLIDNGANRAYFFSYHNGGKDLLGRGYTKMSIVAEKIDITCNSIMREFQNVPRSMFPILYTTLNKHEMYIVSDINIIKERDPLTYQFFRQHNVKAAIFHSIKAPSGMMIGFIGMEYIESTCDDLEAAKRNIQKKAQRITGALVSHIN